MTTAMDVASRAHGELTCEDAEALLHDTTANVDSLRAQNAVTLQTNDDQLRQIDLLRVEADRLRALLDDVSAKNRNLAEERDGLKEQNLLLHEELAAVEPYLIPEDTIVFGAVSRDHMVAEYRRASRITRGPLPPSVVQAVESSFAEVSEVMAEAGAEAVATIVRREVRRRRRAQGRTATPTRRR